MGKGKSKKTVNRPLDMAGSLGDRSSLLPYIEAQAIHETGNYSSPLSIRQNNLFGMNVARNRPFNGFPVAGSVYAGYNSRKDSIDDLILWMDYTKFPLKVSDSLQYVTELKKRGYFTDSIQNYLRGVNSGLDQVPKMYQFKKKKL
jgi:flagellum-specific peptidoglycan hydrolase FlgJ